MSGNRPEGAESRLSTIACPVCEHRAELEMPLNACLYFWTCPHCGTVARPMPGDCCVFCSYGSAPCPPRQRRS